MRRFCRLLGLVCALAVFGHVDAHAQSTASLKKVSIAAVAPTSLFWPLYIAQANGLYKQKGLNVAITFSGSASGPMQLLIAGDADFAVTTADMGVDAATRGAKVSLIAGFMASRPFVMMARPGIKGVADLKGKAVGVAPPRDVSTIAWNEWLRSQHIKKGEIDEIYNTDTASRFAALSNGATSAAMLSPPVSFKAEKAGFTRILDLGDYMRGIPFLSIFARSDWLKTHGDVARAFLATQAEAIDWFYDPANRDKAIEILAARIKMSRPLIEETYEYYFKRLKPFSRNLEVSKDGFSKAVDHLVQAGKLKSKDAIPASFNDAQYRPSSK